MSTLDALRVAIIGRELAIVWSDGHESFYPFESLRKRCPCALCRAEAARPAPADPLRLVKGPRPEDLVLLRASPVGAYALHLVWSDGHDTGIHAFETLRRQCPCPACSSATV
jgi:DUF971 family protein